jgi:hypothetical protein
MVIDIERVIDAVTRELSQCEHGGSIAHVMR